MTMQDNFERNRIEIADSWATSVIDGIEKSRRLAWIVAICSLLVSLFLAVSIAIMMPLKTVEPYTLLVDRQTGHVEALAPLDVQTITPDGALIKSFLAQYVIARESYYLDNVQEDYRKVSLWSAPNERRRYQAGLASTNPASPINTIPANDSLQVTIRSLSLLQKNTALVRFTTTRLSANGTPPQPRLWVAVVRFSFTDAAMSEADRIVNPLGFQVESYRRDQEMIEPDPSNEQATSIRGQDGRGIVGPARGQPSPASLDVGSAQ